MYCNWNLQTQMDKVQQNKYINVYFGCFLFSSLKQYIIAKYIIGQNFKMILLVVSCFKAVRYVLKVYLTPCKMCLLFIRRWGEVSATACSLAAISDAEGANWAQWEYSSGCDCLGEWDSPSSRTLVNSMNRCAVISSMLTDATNPTHCFTIKGVKWGC